ncbi:TPA: hypothetical protein DD712_00705 [Candidatus Acetothermia bacterium]|nr:hypothetical protein [Candidatus Acetothermia bacterium]
MATIKDVAKEAAVSIATVSHVINRRTREPATLVLSLLKELRRE